MGERLQRLGSSLVSSFYLQSPERPLGWALGFSVLFVLLWQINTLVSPFFDVVPDRVSLVFLPAFARVVAVVVASGAEVTLQDIEQALGSRLARFKQPKQVVNVPELPRNTMGKVQKNKLRELYSNLFDD